jgi:hypothetical protein
VSLLDGSILATLPAFPQIYSDTELNPAPVFSLQVNIIYGGILLDAAAQHNVIDGGGVFRILDLLAKALRGEPFSDDEKKHGNRDRSNLIPLLLPEEPMLDHSHLLREPLSGAQIVTQRPAARWQFVRIPALKVAALKDTANEDVRDAQGTFVSTNDARSAFIWKRIAIVRHKQGQEPNSMSKFSRALDARRAMKIPREYLGQMGYNASCYLTFRELYDRTIGEIALFLRRAAERVNSEYSVRSWATFIDREPDKSKIMFGGSFNPDTDIGISSLIHASVNEVEFSFLGTPALVRRPNFLPLEGCVYLWTRTAQGDIDVLLCLKEKDWDGLHAETEWRDHTELIG